MLCRSFLVTILLFIPNSIANGYGERAGLLNDAIVVNAINTYRDDLIRSSALINMDYISSNQTLVNRAHELRINIRNLFKHQYVVRPETCNYTYNLSSNLTTNVQMFIQKCIRDSKSGNENLSFVWNPKFTSIGCSYSSLTKPFILCVLYKPNKPPRTFRAYQADAVHKDFNTNSNKTGGCEPHQNIKSCHLTASTRNNIISKVNKIRQNYGEQNSIQLSPVDWDSYLERAAIEHSNTTRKSINDHCLKSDDRFINQIGVHEFETGNDLKIRPDLDLILPELISNASKYENLSWMYGTQLKAIGCSFFTVGGVGKFVCLFNKRDEYVSSIENETDCNSVQWNLNLIACVVIGITIVVFLIVLDVILHVKIVQKRQPTNY